AAGPVGPVVGPHPGRRRLRRGHRLVRQHAERRPSGRDGGGLLPVRQPSLEGDHRGLRPRLFPLWTGSGLEPGLPRAGGRRRLLHRASGAGLGPAAGRSLTPPWLHTSLSITNTTSSSSAPAVRACAPPSAPPSRA